MVWKEVKEMKNNGIIYNMDNEPVVDIKNGRFLMDLDEKQQQVIDRCLNAGIPIMSFAYKGIPADWMTLVADWLHTTKFSNYQYGYIPDVSLDDNVALKMNSKPTEIDLAVWKLLHTRGVTPEHIFFECFTLAHPLPNNGKIVDLLSEMNVALTKPLFMWRAAAAGVFWGTEKLLSLINSGGSEKKMDDALAELEGEMADKYPIGESQYGDSLWEGYRDFTRVSDNINATFDYVDPDFESAWFDDDEEN